MSSIDDVREHMQVIDAEGTPLGKVDRVEGDRIKLTKKDSGFGHEDHHHFIALELVASVDDNRVRLSANGDVAVMFEEEQDNSPIH